MKETIPIIALMLLSGGMTGYYFGSLLNTNEVKATGKPLDDRQFRILSDMMDQTVSSCYYDLYLTNATSSTPASGDICNNAVIFYKELCQTMNLQSCHSDYFTKYLAGMGE